MEGMNAEHSATKRWLTVVLFAVAMAWAESAAVLYLRTLVGRIEPYQSKPLPDMPGLVTPEIIREAATMVMLGCVGWLAGRTWRARFGYLLIAFGVWDIFYYVFLQALTGWPRSLLDWDILFLIPLPWWGPVTTPMLVAGLMILFGTLSVRCDPPLWPGRRAIGISAAGVAILLWAFMYDALGLLWQGGNYAAIRDSLPAAFPWFLFWPGLALTAAPALDVGLQLMARNGLDQIPKKERTT